MKVVSKGVSVKASKRVGSKWSPKSRRREVVRGEHLFRIERASDNRLNAMLRIVCQVCSEIHGGVCGVTVGSVFDQTVNFCRNKNSAGVGMNDSEWTR